MVTTEELLDALSEYAQDIRNDWSEFDGRSLLSFITRWIEQMRTAIEEEHSERK